MRRNQPNPSDSGSEATTKPAAKSPLASSTAEALSARVSTAPVVPVQSALIAGSASPAVGATFGQTADVIVAAGLISTIGLPVVAQPSAKTQQNANPTTLAAALEAFSKTILNTVADVNALAVPITNLSDVNLGQANQIANAPNPIINAEVFVPVVVIPISPLALPIQSPPIVDISTKVPATEASLIVTTLLNDVFTVVDSAQSDVSLINLAVSNATIANFINLGTGSLTVTVADTYFTSLSLVGNIDFTASNNYANTGVTISAMGDTGNVSLYLHGNQDSTDYISLGNGNDFVLDTGTGNVLIDLGAGQNTVMLVGTGVTGTIKFGQHAGDEANFITLAPNGLANPEALADNNFVTISGLNNDVNSSDALAFLGDMSAQLVWANGTASRAQVTNVSGDPTHLASWISAAQNQASLAHSVAWFQFGGDTFVLETRVGSAGNHAGDTLVKLSGLTQFSGVDGQLTIGMLHFVG